MLIIFAPGRYFSAATIRKNSNEEIFKNQVLYLKKTINIKFPPLTVC